jgi:hypothetical protein
MKKRVSMNYIKQQPALTDFQLELLKLFSFNISGNELLDIKLMLSNYFSDRLSKRVDSIWKNNNLTESDMEIWLNEENQ